MKFRNLANYTKSFFSIGIIGLALANCGGATGSSSGSSTPSNTITGSISLDNTSNYSVMALSDDNEATIVAVDDNGNFSISLADNNYSLALLDENNETEAILVQNNSTIFSINNNTSLGNLSVNLTNKTLTTTRTLSSSLVKGLYAATSIDLTDLGSIDSSNDNDTGVDFEDTELKDVDSDGDMDDDGVPDFLDNDNNQNGIFDNNEGLQVCAIKIDTANATDNSGIGDLQETSCIVFDNLKLASTQLFNGDGDINPHTDNHILAMHIIVPQTLVSLIDTVEATSIPAFADSTVSSNAGGYTYDGTTAQTTYPVTGSDWTDYDPDGDGTGYSLPLSTDPDGNDNYALWVSANDDPVPAIFQFKITLTNGVVAHLTTRLMYVFNTPPKVNTISDDNSGSTTITYPASEGDAGTATNPITLDSTATTLTLTGTRPLTHAGGTTICGMNYIAHIFYYDASNNPINTTAIFSSSNPDTGICSSSTSVDIELDLATYFPTTYDGTAVAKYKVDFTSTGDNNDNSAEMLYFTY